MAKNDFVKAKPADLSLRPLGHARENKSADSYTGFVYPQGGGNDIGVYKQPMNNPNGSGMEAVTKPGNCLNEKNISVGGISKSQMDEVKTSGVKTRGNGCATKGTMARGPLA